MTIDEETTRKIRRLFFAEHWPVGTIAAQTDVHRDVVVRVVGLSSPRRVVPAPPSSPLLAEHRDFIHDTLTQYPTLRATRLYDMLAARGYQGSVRTVREHVARVRPRRPAEAYLRLETFPGEQAQVDWAFIGQRDVPGGRRGLWLFVMVLSWSRMLFAECVWDLGAASLRRSLVRAHAFFGGSPRQWLFDNARSVVLARHGDAARFHPELTDLAGAFCTEPRLCRVRKPTDKGRVERAVRYLRDRFLAGRHLRDAAHGNRELEGFLRDIAPARPHARQAEQTVGAMYAQERERLLPLPDPTPEASQTLPVVIDATAFARFDTNLYSVPPQWASQGLTLVADDDRVRVLDGGEVVADHPRCWGRRQTIEDHAHRAALLAQRAAAHNLKGRDRLRVEIPGVDALLERWVLAGRNVGNAVARTVAALDLYGPEWMRAAVAEALTRDVQDPGALGAICERLRAAERRPVQIAPVFGAHVRDTDVIPHDLGDYDAR
ncbi:MAG: IS21 family transposase [Polyangiales bacterium]